LGVRVEVRAELGERLEVAVLRELQLQPPGDFFHRADLGVAADARDGDADVDRGTHAGVEEFRLEEDLPVGDRDHVRGDVRGDVTRLRLDDRERRQRAAPEIIAELDGPLEQPRVQVEDVAGVRLAAGRTPQEQRHLPVGVGVLGEVVVDAQRVLSAIQEVLAHRAAGVGRQVLDRRRLVGPRGDDDRVLQRARFVERLGERHDRRHALADGDVHRHHAGVPVVDDRVDRDRGLARLAVADDELALPTADRDHRIDRLQAGLHRFLDRLALDDAGRLELGGTCLGCPDLALSVQRAAQRVDDAAEQLLANRDVQQLTRTAHGVALRDPFPLAEQHGADVVGLEVQGQPGDAVRELEQLEGHAVLKAVQPRDAICDRQHGADLGQLGASAVESFDAALEDACDLVWVDLHVGSPD
jgi:hypothetical protein